MSDTPEVATWLVDTLQDAGPFRWEPLSGGNSNETLRLTSPSGRWIVRRAPQTAVAAGAHDMSREFTVLTALGGQGAPTPRAVGLCPAEIAGGRPFLVIEHLPGRPLSDRFPDDWSRSPSPQALSELGRTAVDGLAALHRVDVSAVGLDGFGRPDGYLARQVPRWRAQYERARTRDLPVFEQVAAELERRRPADRPAAVLHGDFHLDNALFEPGPPIRMSGIIDWELATVGDPLVDLGLLLAFWGPDRPDHPALPHVQELTRVAGAPTRAELADRYVTASGRDITDLGWYMGLAFFKLAAIIEGAYRSYVEGCVDSDYARGLEHDVPALLDEAADLLARHP